MVDKLSVLRECHRVLKPGGRMAGYVIHTPHAVSAAEAARADQLGPTHASGPAAPDRLARQAGFRVLQVQDVTAEFRATCRALLRARNDLEAELRAEEGDAYFDEERTKKETMLLGMDEGLLLRSLLLVEKIGQST